MDAEIVEMTLPDGTLMLVRAERIGDKEDDQRPSDIGMRQIFSFSRITATVRGVAAELHKALEAVSPDLVSVELGFDMAVKGSQVIALIADAGAHASITVRLEWHGSSNHAAVGPNAVLPGDSVAAGS
jgi:hypothetical protein